MDHVPPAVNTEGLDAFDLACDDALALVKARVHARAGLVAETAAQVAALESLASKGLLVRQTRDVYRLVPGAELPQSSVDTVATTARLAAVLLAVNDLLLEGYMNASVSRIAKRARLHGSVALACLHALDAQGRVRSYRSSDRRSGKTRNWGLPLRQETPGGDLTVVR